ncbi:tRNA (guanosine(37)-N1)-methyltransferase TrmD [Vulcanibacillus modesticaldus]|uniref:tRNA (guanine-N(1)-)-methyltransferase n=1 Tax=Vulcanibacillus modesticaldus TaxID=337097 RepID=A0A1D2YXR8_9BACI|nr:tRNA (guanosine(37)-N1)-methyltransferase TrmD [Vulcanibacillus modesticaldus]OEG00376.1 tRNA (guanosine(37)-N1)-methyltransferase TrmD [Vulcanibacillus modesticaldus]
MKIDILTLFPEMFQGVLGSSILKRAQEKEVVKINLINFRDFSTSKHKTVDDYPYGGGNGMVLKPEPIFAAVESITDHEKARIIMLTPQGKTFNQRIAEELKEEKHLIFLCGHYEGFDERIREHLVTDELSIGDYVLTGGELATMVVMDSVVRLLPGVLGNEGSVETDSFSTGLLEYPQYTRPEVFREWKVPEILLSGHHQKIEEWRRKESFKRTLERRPDLIDINKLDEKDRALIKELKRD